MIQYNNSLVVSITTPTHTTSSVVGSHEFGPNVVRGGAIADDVANGKFMWSTDDPSVPCRSFDHALCEWESVRYHNTETRIVDDPTTIADILLQQDSMWDNDHTVVDVRMPTTLTPGEARVIYGEVSAYTSETCPVCGRVYSGADIRRHLRTHDRKVRKQRHVLNLRIKDAMSAVVLEEMTRVTHTYESESEGLVDTNEQNTLPQRVGTYTVSELIALPHPTIPRGDADTVAAASYNVLQSTADDYMDPRWLAMKDGHIQEMQDAYTVGRGGTNPKYTYFWRQAHTREERTRSLAQWIRTAHLSAVLRAMNAKTLHTRRMRTLSASLGFDTTPRGKWPGVDSSEELGLHRVTGYVGDTPIIRLPDYSSLYLTKEQVSYLHSLMETRKEGGNRVVTAPTRAQAVVKPITMADIADNWAQIMTGVHILR